MAKKAVRKKESSFLVQFFTSEDYWVIQKIQFQFEEMFYDHYKYVVDKPTVLGIKSKPVDVGDLPEHTINSFYNAYVAEAKKLGEGYYGIALEFIYVGGVYEL